LYLLFVNLWKICIFFLNGRLVSEKYTISANNMAVVEAENVAIRKRGRIPILDGQKNESAAASRPPNIGITTMVDSSLQQKATAESRWVGSVDG
jgi:hypothetical protein